MKRMQRAEVRALETDLRREFNWRTRQIETALAKALGLGDINDMDRPTLTQLEEDVEHLINEFDESALDGDTLQSGARIGLT